MPSYDHRMNALRLLVALAVVGAAQSALAADPVNHCKGPDGRMTITDRPCGDPATERSVQRPTLIVEQIQAEDIFRAREMVRRDGSALSSPELTQSPGTSRDRTSAEAGR